MNEKYEVFLTLLGIIIGVSTIIILISLSGILEQSITGELSKFGPNTILIAPRISLGSGPPTGLGVFTESDEKVVESLAIVESAEPIIQLNSKVTVGTVTKPLLIRAFEIKNSKLYIDYINQDILEGRFLRRTDKNSINIGYALAKEYFDKELFVGNTLKIEDDKYTVVGIFKKEGDLRKDLSLYTQINDLRKTFDHNKGITAISVKIFPGIDIDLAEQKIIKTLKKKRGEEDFLTTTPNKIKDTINDILQIITYFIVGIGSISVFVAFLSIMNSLFTSVYQRTKEIGSFKAMGAKNSDILLLYLLESFILGLVGGLLGLFFGVLLVFIIVFVINSFSVLHLNFFIDITLLYFSLLFSIIISLFAGFFPSYRASKLKPVDALRHE